ncbi:hypothetical protein Tco_0698872 [Tanacetum coccineum]
MIRTGTKEGMIITRDRELEGTLLHLHQIKDKCSISILVNTRSVQSATSIILVTALCVVYVTKWATLPDTARVKLLMKDQDQLVLSVEILTNLGGISQGRTESLPQEEIAQTPC